MQPTERDIANAKLRQDVADRQRDAYTRVLRLAMGKFGPGWLPAGRHFLVGKDEEERARREGGPVKASATVYSATNGVSKRYFTVTEEGKVVEHKTWEEGFGDMLLEPEPVRTIEVKGQLVHPHRYSLCWAGFEPNYAPKTADALAAAREKREARKPEREAARVRSATPLLAWIERVERADDVEKER